MSRREVIDPSSRHVPPRRHATDVPPDRRDSDTGHRPDPLRRDATRHDLPPYREAPARDVTFGDLPVVPDALTPFPEPPARGLLQPARPPEPLRHTGELPLPPLRDTDEFARPPRPGTGELPLPPLRDTDEFAAPRRRDSGEVPAPLRHDSGEVPASGGRAARRREQHAAERSGSAGNRRSSRSADGRSGARDGAIRTFRAGSDGDAPEASGRAARRRDAGESTRRRGTWRRREPAPELDILPTPRERGAWREITPGEVPAPGEDARPTSEHRILIEPDLPETPRREVPRRGAGRAAAPAPTVDEPQPTVVTVADPPSRRSAYRATPDGIQPSRPVAEEEPARRLGPRRTKRKDTAASSAHREARSRPATSRELAHARDFGPRRHRRGGRRQIGFGLLAVVTVASVATAAVGYALSLQDTETVPRKAAAATPCNQTGPGQRDVEAYLSTRSAQYGPVKVDGLQSATDCVAIANFQKWAEIPSRTGFADATTGFLARQLASIRFDQCGAPGDRTTVCVDLTNQAMWVVRSGRVILGPTPARSGRPGDETPTGEYTITQKKVSTVSSEYGTPLPYWERFVDDIGFHAADTPMYAPIAGSFGCVNLLMKDAKALYALTEIGTDVRVFGAKPGT